MNSVFNIRWPDTDLVSRLKVLALANRRSLQAEVLVALERHVALVLPAVAPEAIREPEGVPEPESSWAEFVRPRPSAAQVAKRSYTPDPK